MIPKKLLLVFFLAIFFSCEREKAENDCEIWVSINETQCYNPWQNISSEDTESKVIKYLENNGILIFGFYIETYSSGPFCHACNCPSGKIIHVLISASDTDEARILGFNK